jgi:hypothetical protein
MKARQHSAWRHLEGKRRCESPIGPIIEDELPNPRSAFRWTYLLKAKLLFAVKGGLLTFNEVHERYHISVQEFTEWERRYETGGIEALRAGRAPRQSGSEDLRAALETILSPGFGKGGKS